MVLNPPPPVPFAAAVTLPYWSIVIVDDVNVPVFAMPVVGNRATFNDPDVT